MFEDDEAEQLFNKYNLKTKTLGFNSPEAYEDYKSHAMNGMMAFGSSFTKALGKALCHAELEDAVKLIRTWRSKCEEYSMLWRIAEAKHRAKGEKNVSV
jgi:hypothetical protein